MGAVWNAGIGAGTTLVLSGNTTASVAQFTATAVALIAADCWCKPTETANAHLVSECEQNQQQQQTQDGDEGAADGKNGEVESVTSEDTDVD